LEIYQGAAGGAILRFPEWSPQSLVDHYLNLQGLSAYEVALYERLLVNPEMKNVWKTWDKESGSDPLLLFYQVVATISLCKLPHKTKAEELEELQAIAKTAHELWKLIQKSDLRDTLFSYLTPGECEYIWKHFDKETNAKGGFCLFPIDEEARNIFPFTPGGYLAIHLPFIPPMTEILLRIADEADTRAQSLKGRKSLLPRPNIKNAEALCFIRRMGLYFYEKLGSYHYRTLANLTRAALDDESIDTDKVRDTLQTLAI
jgi:hypothetical protein